MEMKTTLAAGMAVIALALGLAPVWADEERLERDPDAVQVARAWFNSLVEGETAVTLALSSVPFDFDGHWSIESMTDLKNRYDEVIASKGRRDIDLTSIEIESSSEGKAVVLIWVEDEKVRVEVESGDVFRVVGFSD